MLSAVFGPLWLPVMISEVGRTVNSQTVATSDMRREQELVLSELKRVLVLGLWDLKCDMNNKCEGISRRRSALKRRKDCIGDQGGQRE